MTDAEIKYDITKEQCQEMIDKSPVVCPRCGGKLEPIETVNNADIPTYWSGCNACGMFSWGFPPEVFQIANQIVRDRHFQPYSHDPFPYNGTDEQKDYWYKNQTGGACSTVAMILNLYKTIITNR